MVMMALMCLVPIIVVIVVADYLKTDARVWTLLPLLLCVGMHVWMMKKGGHNHG